MLVLTRNVGQVIRIGDDIQVTVTEVRGGAVRLGIAAPASVRVRREEAGAGPAGARGSGKGDAVP